MSYQNAYDGRTPIVIESIEPDEGFGAVVPDRIDFTPNDSPDVSVTTSGRYATHDIIGGVTVRQKVGEDPVEIDVDGVCDEQTAKQIDQLRNARRANFISDRISITVQVASTTTSPQTSGGAVDMDRGEFLYNYGLSLIGVEPIDSPEGD